MDGRSKFSSPSAVAVQVGKILADLFPTWIWRMPLKPLCSRGRRQVGNFCPRTSPPGPRLSDRCLPSILEAKSWTGRANSPRRPSWRPNHGREEQILLAVRRRRPGREDFGGFILYLDLADATEAPQQQGPSPGRELFAREHPHLARTSVTAPRLLAETAARHPSWRLNHGRDGQKQCTVHKKPHYRGRAESTQTEKPRRKEIAKAERDCLTKKSRRDRDIGAKHP